MPTGRSTGRCWPRGVWRVSNGSRPGWPREGGILNQSYTPAADARIAASLLLLRDGAQGLEVLMLRRAERDGDLRSGVAVFPGGVVDAQDHEAQACLLGPDDAAASQALGLTPVSYTHLDVYKRQLQSPPRHGQQLQLARGVHGLVRRQPHQFKRLAQVCFGPVSYTHLDVYKRQVQRRATGAVVEPRSTHGAAGGGLSTLAFAAQAPAAVPPHTGLRTALRP